MIQFHLCIFHVAHITLQHTHTHRLFLSTHSTLYFYFSLCSQKKQLHHNIVGLFCSFLCLLVSIHVRSKQKQNVCVLFFVSFRLVYYISWFFLLLSCIFLFFVTLFHCTFPRLYVFVCLRSFSMDYYDSCKPVCCFFSLEFIYLVCYTQLHKYASICVQNHLKRKTQLSACLPLLLTFSFVRSFFSVHLKVTHRHKRAIQSLFSLKHLSKQLDMTVMPLLLRVCLCAYL